MLYNLESGIATAKSCVFLENGGIIMAYSYNRLWKLMIDKNINRTALRKQAGITSNAMAKMGKNQPVNMEVLAKVCHVLNCGIEDIVEIIDDENQEA